MPGVVRAGEQRPAFFVFAGATLEMIDRASSTRPVLVLLTGAGFSCGFGLPTTAGLRDASFSYWGGDRHQYRAAFKSIWTSSPYCEFRSDEKYLFETLIANADEVSWTGSPRDRYYYKWFLWNLCIKLTGDSHAAAVNSAVRFGEFVEWLTLAATKFDVRLATLNYDLVLELACRKAGFGFWYLHPGECWPAGLPIRKLHGSANWMSFENHVRSKHADTIEIFKTGEHSVFAAYDLQAKWSDVEIHAPTIVPPSPGKTYSGVLGQIWEGCLADLTQAERIAIVGYRFPPEDEDAAGRIAHTLKQSAAVRRRYMCKLDSDDLSRVENLLQGNDWECINSYWSIDHLNELLQ